MKKIIKWSGLVIGLAVVISLFYYVSEKKNRPVVSSDDLLRLALTEIREHQNYPKAISLTRQALAATPAYTDVEVTLARAFMLNGNTDSAKWHLENIIGNDKKHAQSLLYLVNISLQEKDTVSAINYLDRYVGYYPAEKDSWIKEYVLLLQQKKYDKAASVYKSYTKKFDKDSIAVISFDYWQSKAIDERKSKDLASAYESYQKAIRYHPQAPAVLQQLVNLGIHFKDYFTALQYNQELLRLDTTNRQYLLNASTIYQKLDDNGNAALYAGKAYALNPADEIAKKNLADLYLSLAKDATAVNRIYYATLTLNILPAQKEALLYLINAQMEMHQYSAALDVINTALHYYPKDQAFIDKKIGVLSANGNYLLAISFIESVLKENINVHYIQAYNEVASKLITPLIKQEKWDEAFTLIQKGLSYNSSNKVLLEELVNVYVSQQKTADAISTLDKLLAIDPANENYRFKKSGLLESQQLFDVAAQISGALYREHPGVTQYKEAYLDQLLGAEKAAVAKHNWDLAVYYYNRATATSPPGYFQLLFAMAAYTGKKDSLHVLALTDTALRLYPADSLFLVKRSLAYEMAAQYPEALTTSRGLLVKYPSDTTLQAMYLDQLYTAGKYYEKENKNDAAINTFLTAYSFAPKDTFALMNLSAIYFVRKQFDSSIVYADMGLQLDSNNIYLLMKKAAAHEQLKQYKPAYLTANRVLQLQPSKNIAGYTDYLHNKTYRNQAGITHLHSFFSSPGQYASVTGLQYMRRFENGSVTGKLNYGDRPAGSGIQVGVDLYYTHDSTYYSNLFVNRSSGKAFPYWQAGYSLYRNFKKGWEAELGIRYLGFDSINNYTTTTAIGKYLNSTWLNLRGYYTYNTKDWFQSYQLTVRQYISDRNDYLSLIAGLGNIPDDQSLNYRFNNFSGLTSKSIGLGFQKTFRYKTTFQAFFNYTNLQVAAAKRISQYDAYITLLRNF